MKMNKLALLILLFVIVFVVSGCATKNPATPSGSGSSESISSGCSEQKTFTLSELSKYNGKNGVPAYIAVNGVVYDVTNVKQWSGGTHNGFSAGQDLSQAIKQSPHGTSVLQGLPIVGKLQ